MRNIFLYRKGFSQLYNFLHIIDWCWYNEMSIYGWFGSGLIVKYMIAEHEMRDQMGIIVYHSMYQSMEICMIHIIYTIIYEL
jgi:hypothetical protein